MVKVMANKKTLIKYYNTTANSSSYTTRDKPLVLHLGMASTLFLWVSYNYHNVNKIDKICHHMQC